MEYEWWKYSKIVEKYYPNKTWGINKNSEFFVEGDDKVDINKLWNEIKKEIFMEQIREERNKLLDETDKYFISDWVSPDKEKYRTYRKELRDLPAKYEALMTENYDYKDKVLTKNGEDHNYFPSI